MVFKDYSYWIANDSLRKIKIICLKVVGVFDGWVIGLGSFWDVFIRVGVKKVRRWFYNSWY